ncbi:signal recognition particle protein [Alloscardovia macacae]|uniref:Signal recognition particle protein n=1 Tax=Alloscardovia macacae TaxID=1160091 RepID=A0A1Y2SU58_9BIFI|nr:signal recognition particle protein [Alloscardovia macacae]OTA26610.1 signal recognition particle protein [Alloscardovia macacae]OTA29004.1 signal recognition particle protein [Alloscardovia macacae]
MATFSSLTDRLSSAFKNLRSKGKLSEADIDGTIREIRRALLDADVAVDVVRAFTGRIRERALGAEVSDALNPAQQVVSIVHEELTAILGAGVDRPLNFAKNPPTIIMLAGLQGAGKTTLAGKLGYWLKDAGHTPLLVAADLQRPNAVTQLEVVGERAGVPVFAPERGVSSEAVSAGLATPGTDAGDPVQVARDSIDFARQKMYDTVIIDTAGRLGIDEELMAQARSIRDAVQPDEILFVIDAMIGQDAVTTAKAFDEGVDFTGVVLSKVDGDARGGAALSVASVTGKPILFSSTGEGLKDFEVFHPDRMSSRILDMGDILTLIEQAQKQFDEQQAREAAAKMSEGTFGLDDFLEQLQQVRKLGSMKSLLGMIPGMAAHRKELEQLDEREIDRTEAIIRSMTPAERRDPSIINGSRRARIAYGSGVTVTQVNGLLQRFEQAAKMMKRMGGSTGIPGFGGAMGMGAPAANSRKGKKLKAAQKKKAKGKSGNPMKRAQEEQALRDRLAGKSSGAAGASGLGAGAAQGASFMKQPGSGSAGAGLPGGLPDGMPQLPEGFGGLGNLLGRN